MARKIILAQLGLDEKAFIQAANNTKKAIDELIIKQKKLNKNRKDNRAEIVKNEIQLKKLRTEYLQQQKAIIALESPYAKLSNRLIRARKEFKDLAATQGISNKRLTEARTKVLALDRQLKRIDKSVGQSQRKVGAYGSAIKGLATSYLGLTAVIFGAIRAVRNIIGIFTKFEKENAILNGILQQTNEQTKALRDNAEELGAVTAKTATEVTGLQIAFARLGFTQGEILNLTEATIAGSIAMNSELAETATLVGAIIRSMDALDSADADMVIDVLALATAKSALNFEKLSKALPIVLGAANALEIPFTKVVATLGKLSDSGIDASTSATAFRNILIESAKQGIDYEEAIAKITISTTKLTTANELFGKRAAVSSLIISNNTEALKDLDEALQQAQGTAKEMADKQLVTLAGKTILATSAWQGFILAIENGQGTFSTALKSMVDGVTGLLTELTLLNKVTEVLSKEDLRGSFLGIPFVGGIRKTAKASAQLKLLNEDFKDFKKEGVEQLIKEYIVYTKRLEKVGNTDKNHTKLLEFQLIRIEELIKAKKDQIIIDEASADILFEQKQGIIDILLESDKKLKASDLEKKSIEELNIVLNNALNDENIRIKKQEAARKKAKKQSGQDKIDAEKARQQEIDDSIKFEEDELKRIVAFTQRKTNLENQLALQKAETAEEKAILKSEQDFEKHLLELDNLKLTTNEKDELEILLLDKHLTTITDIKFKAMMKQISDEQKADAKALADKKKLNKQIIDEAINLAGQQTRLGQALIAIKGILAAKETLIGLNILKAKVITNVGAATADVAAGTAATAKVGFPQNIPLLIAFAAQVAGIISAIAGAAGAAKNISTPKFYEGGKVKGQNIPTQQGGDNILATVKSGEVILNDQQQERAGGDAFFRSIGVPGFQDGGIVGVPSTTLPITQQLNTTEFAEILADRINDIKIVAIEEEISEAIATKVEIVDGANI